MSPSSLRRIRVWDLPVRLFHWALVLLMLLLFASAYAGRMEVHATLGLMALVLVLFRLIWGFVGSQTAKFREFVRGPRGVLSYLRGTAPSAVGHNPLGGLMVLVLLAALLLQALLGTFSSDGMEFNGPFVPWIGSMAAERMARLHVLLAYAIAALSVIHVLAVLLHLICLHDNLITPMLSGSKWLPPHTVEPLFQSSAIAFAIVGLLIALIVAALKFV